VLGDGIGFAGTGEELGDGPLGGLGEPGERWPEPLCTAPQAVSSISRAPAAPWRTPRIGTAPLCQAQMRTRRRPRTFWS
jgi:hypothetical protein